MHPVPVGVHDGMHIVVVVEVQLVVSSVVIASLSQWRQPQCDTLPVAHSQQVVQPNVIRIRYGEYLSPKKVIERRRCGRWIIRFELCSH